MESLFVFGGVGGFYGSLGLLIGALSDVQSNPHHRLTSSNGTGEFTNPIQISFYVCEDLGLERWRHSLRPLLLYSFAFARLVLTPITILTTTLHALEQSRDVVPLWWIVVYLSALCALVVGSAAFSRALWREQQAFLKASVVKSHQQ